MGAVVTGELELSTHLAGAWASESTPVWGTAPEFEDCILSILTHFVVHNKSLSFYAWEICSFQQSFVLQRDEETWRALHDNKQMSHYLNYLAKSGGKSIIICIYVQLGNIFCEERPSRCFRYKMLFVQYIQSVYH